MSKVSCERMKGRQLNTAFGQFKFDQQGIAEVPDEYVNKLLTLNGYKLVGDKPAEPEKEDVPDVQNGAESGQVDKTSNGGENDENGVEQSEEDAGQEDENQPDEVEDAEQEPEKSDKPAVTVEYLNGKNVAQLKKIAKDNGIDLAGATKKDEIIPIILGAMNQ